MHSFYLLEETMLVTYELESLEQLKEECGRRWHLSYF